MLKNKIPVDPSACGTTVGAAVNGIAARMSCDGGYYHALQPLAATANFTITSCSVATGQNVQLTYYACPVGMYCPEGDS